MCLCGKSKNIDHGWYFEFIPCRDELCAAVGKEKANKELEDLNKRFGFTKEDLAG